MSFAGGINEAKARKAADAGYTVRPMKASDAGSVGQVHVQVWRETYQSLMPTAYLDALDPEEFTSRWLTRLTTPAPPEARHLVGVGPNGRIVGIGSAGPSRDQRPPTDWELWAINLLATEHGTGLADLMMAELVGGANCSLWVLPGNSRAVAFYSRYGFRADGVTKPHLPTGTTEIRMVRK